MFHQVLLVSEFKVQLEVTFHWHGGWGFNTTVNGVRLLLWSCFSAQGRRRLHSAQCVSVCVCARLCVWDSAVPKQSATVIIVTVVLSHKVLAGWNQSWMGALMTSTYTHSHTAHWHWYRWHGAQPRSVVQQEHLLLFYCNSYINICVRQKADVIKSNVFVFLVLLHANRCHIMLVGINLWQQCSFCTSVQSVIHILCNEMIFSLKKLEWIIVLTFLLGSCIGLGCSLQSADYCSRLYHFPDLHIQTQSAPDISVNTDFKKEFQQYN